MGHELPSTSTGLIPVELRGADAAMARSHLVFSYEKDLKEFIEKTHEKEKDLARAIFYQPPDEAPETVVSRGKIIVDYGGNQSVMFIEYEDLDLAFERNIDNIAPDYRRMVREPVERKVSFEGLLRNYLMALTEGGRVKIDTILYMLKVKGPPALIERNLLRNPLTSGLILEVWKARRDTPSRVLLDRDPAKVTIEELTPEVAVPSRALVHSR